MIRTRFAPSPTGFLHLGHAYAALFAWRAAEQSGGDCLLRIEDIDQGRCRPEYEAAIIEDLFWLGCPPTAPIRRQSDELPRYRLALDRLIEDDWLYPCFCTRKEIAAEIAASTNAPQGPDGPLYPGTCRALSPDAVKQRQGHGMAFAWRLDAAKAAARLGSLTFEESGETGITGQQGVTHGLFGDAVVARKDSPASYHLCVVVDDADQGVTLVTRGADLLPAAHLQRVLQAALGLPEPAYRHHRLILDEKGNRLAKRDAARTLRNLREAGTTPDEIRTRLGFST